MAKFELGYKRYLNYYSFLALLDCSNIEYVQKYIASNMYV